MIAVNPVDDVDPPRVERAKMMTLRPGEQAAILAAAYGSDLYVPILLALATGLRRGELLGLAWAKYRSGRRPVHVLQVIEETKEGARVKPQPKTTHGRRSVTLPQAAIEALRQHKAAQAEECLRLGLGKPDLLFPRWATSPAVFGTAFTRMAARIGIKAGVHMLRHTHITDLLAAGAHPRS